MGFDKGTIPNGTVVTVTLLAVVGLLLVGATPAAAQSDDNSEFDFDIDGNESEGEFGFNGANNSSPVFNFGDAGEPPRFNFGELRDAPDFSGIGSGASEAPDFTGIGGGSGDAPDFSGIGSGARSPPDFSGIGQGGDGDDGDNGDGDGNDTEPAPANFQVSNLNAPGTATVGDTITVSADVTNDGESEGTQTVSFGVDTDDDGNLEELASQDETLASGASTTVTFDVDTSSLSAGTYTHGVSTANDSATASITLESGGTDQPANFQVQNIDTNSPVTEGETLTLDATVENIGDLEGTQTVTLTLLDESNSSDVTLAGGATKDVTLSVPTQAGDAGSSSAKVETANDSVTTTVQIDEDSGSGGTEYQSFTAWAESGYLLVGNNNLQAPLPDCPGGVPENESKGCVKFTADYDPATGDYTVTPENFEFPPIPFEDTTLGTVPANNTATGDITGNLNPETGEASFSAPIFSYLENAALDDSCGLEVNVEGTTGQSGSLTGSPGAIQDNGTARATLVDGEFSIPAATQDNCGLLYTAVNNDVGLPAGTGENEIVQNLYLEFSEQTVANNPDAPSN